MGSNYVPDAIVAVSRGGLIPARIVSDVINVDEVHSVKASLWGVGGKISEEVMLYDVKLPVRGKRVLLVDDVVDSGSTLNRVLDFVKGLEPEDVRTAVLHVKPSSKHIPDYYASRLDEWSWIIYPWTLHEVIFTLLYKKHGCGFKFFDSDYIIKEFNSITGLVVDEVTPNSLETAKHRYLKTLCNE